MSSSYDDGGFVSGDDELGAVECGEFGEEATDDARCEQRVPPADDADGCEQIDGPREGPLRGCGSR